MTEPEIPWPRKGDELFKADDDWWNNASLNFAPDHWSGYAEGYKLAADTLVEYIMAQAAEHKRTRIDFLVYPVVFLYRHHIELRLKEIIWDGNQLLDIPGGFPEIHNLLKLWTLVRAIFEQVWPDSQAEDWDAAEDYIRQFSERDPMSLEFRYGRRKDGTPSLPGLSHINLRNLAAIMDRLASMLDGASLGISVYLDNKLDALAHTSEAKTETYPDDNQNTSNEEADHP